MIEGRENFDNLTRRCAALNSQTQFRQQYPSPVVEFSNTGRRGLKFFSISLRALQQTLKDIYSNFSVFDRIRNYEETKWRDAFSAYLTDEPTNALSTVQTLPLYTVIAKVLHITNNLPPASYNDGTMALTKENLETAIEYLDSQIPDEEMFMHLSPKEIKADSMGVNRIYYGAPGTGKSYSIDQEIESANSIRVVFHADTQFTDFVGCLKPSMNGTDVQYSFRSGPFINALIIALQNPEQMYWLVIEEINRAPAAAVFGEVFQLLDRDVSGESKYGITPSDPEVISHVEAKIGRKLEHSQIRLPANLSILATMNSSDQAVMPMDTAFKRRWKFKYVPLNFDLCASGSFDIYHPEGSLTVEWKHFALAINKILSDLAIPEDRHLGPFFLSDHDLIDEESRAESLTGKLFMYLWDDVLRHGNRPEIFFEEINTYGQLNSRFYNSEQIFSDKFFDELKLIQGSSTIHIAESTEPITE